MERNSLLVTRATEQEIERCDQLVGIVGRANGQVYSISRIGFGDDYSHAQGGKTSGTPSRAKQLRSKQLYRYEHRLLTLLGNPLQILQVAIVVLGSILHKGRRDNPRVGRSCLCPAWRKRKARPTLGTGRTFPQ